MVTLQEIDLAALGIRFPHNRVGVVVLQPFQELTDQEPYKCAPGARARSLAAIARTLAVARECSHTEQKTHFTVLPELSIPFPEGIEMIADAMTRDDWPNQTVVVGGVEGLAPGEYAILCARPNTVVDLATNGPGLVQAAQWVNCSVTWAKADDGRVYSWIQPKICPSWLERNVQHQDMYCGGSVYLYKARFSNNTMCRFLSLICFDWVGEHQGQRIVPQLLEAVGAQAGGEQIPLHWIFVLQSNPEPSHHTFLMQINRVLTDPNLAPNTRRDNTCLLFANVSGKASPGAHAEYGMTSAVFSPGAPFYTKDGCRPTFSVRGKGIRKVDTLGMCVDTIFREAGSCIHSYSQNVPDFVERNAASKIHAIHIGCVHTLDDSGPTDPRAPNGQVSCSVKWVNDALDQLRVLPHPDNASQVATGTQPVHNENVAAIRPLDGRRLTRSIELATQTTALRTIPDPESWGSMQSEALETIVDCLDILALAYAPPDVAASTCHATLTANGHSFDVVVVRGKSHELCAEYVRHRALPEVRKRLLVVSRDQDNTVLRAKHKRIFDVSVHDGADPKVTSAGQPVYMAFQEILDAYQTSSTPAELTTHLDAKLVQ